MPDGDQTYNDVNKALDSDKNVLNAKKSVLEAFSDVKADLDARSWL